MSRKRPASPPPAAPTPVGKVFMWIVVATCVAVMYLLMKMAREILAELKTLGGTGGAQSTRLLTGLFVVMCLGGFTAAAWWAALKKALGRDKN